MAQIGKQISSKQLVWEIYRDSGIQDQINQADVYEWIVRVLALIGNPNAMLKKVTGHNDNPNLDIVNYRAKLPCDFFRLRQIVVNGFPALPSSNTFQQLMDGGCCGVDEIGNTLTSGTFVDNFGNTFITNLGENANAGPITYELNNDYVTLSVKQGKVCISYLAHAVDKEGFPLIPDDPSYIEAVKWYCLSKIDYLRWRNNPDSPGLKALYEHSEGEYNWYVGQAANAAKRVDPDTMEVIKNQLLRLKPEISNWSSLYKNMGVPELRKIK